MPAVLEQGMGDCVQTEVLNNVDILKKGSLFPLNGEQVYNVSEMFTAIFRQLIIIDFLSILGKYEIEKWL